MVSQGLSPLGWGLLGLEMGAFTKDALSAWYFLVALCAPWFRHVERFKGISPQHYADNL